MKFHAARLKTTAKIGIARPIARTKNGFSFVGAERLAVAGQRLDVVVPHVADDHPVRTKDPGVAGNEYFVNA